MEIKTAIVTRPLELGEYDETLRGQTLQVWVNPPKDVRAERLSILAEMAALIRMSVSTATDAVPAKKKPLALALAWFKPRKAPQSADPGLPALQLRAYVWLAQILSQGEAPVSVEELERLIEADQVLYEWILKRAVEMIEAFRAEKKSPSKPPLKS